MDSFYNIAFYFLLIILFAVAVILFAGIFVMAKGGSANKKYSNKINYYIKNSSVEYLIIFRLIPGTIV